MFSFFLAPPLMYDVTKSSGERKRDLVDVTAGGWSFGNEKRRSCLSITLGIITVILIIY